MTTERQLMENIMFAMRYALLALLTSLVLARPGWAHATTFCQINIPLSCVGTNGWGPIVFDNWYGAGSNAGLCMNRMFSYYAACSPTSAPDSVMPITASFYSGSELIQTNSFSPTP